MKQIIFTIYDCRNIIIFIIYFSKIILHILSFLKFIKYTILKYIKVHESIIWNNLNHKKFPTDAILFIPSPNLYECVDYINTSK